MSLPTINPQATAAASPTASSVSLPSNSEDPEENVASSSLSPDDTSRRPHAPVAQTLDKQEQRKHALSSNEIIPNLLHSGKFPPPPRSPRHSSMSHSPPPIMNTADLPFTNSPIYPAAPPGTPYTPHAVVKDFSLPSLDNRPNPPPFDHQDERYHSLLSRFQSKALADEKSRVESLKEHESLYTTIDEYKHALARERRHTLGLVQELSYHKFNSKYQSCSLYSEAEINEEAKVNLLIKNMEGIIKEKEEDKIKTVMELEREEERMINVLMGRLESVNREKTMLEKQIYGAGGSGSGLGGAGRGTAVGALSRFENMEGVEVTMPHHSVQQPAAQDGEFHAVVPKYIEQQSETNQINNEDIAECDDEDEDEKEDQDILDDKFHDPDMEKELNNLLEKKNANK